MSAGEFSVWQFFGDDRHERVRSGVDAHEAIEAAKHYCTCVAAKLGVVRRVIITDGGDDCCFDWRYGEGLVYPTAEDISPERAAKDFLQ